MPTLQTYDQQGVFWLTRYYTPCEILDADGKALDVVKLLQRTPLKVAKGYQRVGMKASAFH